MYYILYNRSHGIFPQTWHLFWIWDCHWSSWIHAYRGIVYAGAVAWAFVAACPISIPMPGSRQDASGFVLFDVGRSQKMENLWKFPQNVAWHIFFDWNLAINLVKPNNMKVSRFVKVGIRDFCVKIPQILFASPDLWLWQIGTMTVTGPISGLAVCGSQEVKNALVQKIRRGRQLRRSNIQYMIWSRFSQEDPVDSNVVQAWLWLRMIMNENDD